MKTAPQGILPDSSGFRRRVMMTLLLIGTQLAPLVQAGGPIDSVRYIPLSNPTPAQLKVAGGGLTMLPTGLDSAMPKSAIDDQIGRVGHTMFADSHKGPQKDDGTPTTQGGDGGSDDDDGC